MTLTLTIAGGPVGTDRTMPVVDPATAEVTGEAPACSLAQVDDAVRAAWDAWPAWAGLPAWQRRDHLRRVGALLGAHAAEIADLLTVEQGKPLVAARGEVDLAASWFDHTAALCLDDEQIADDGAASVTMRRTARGPVAAIAPFNFPIILSVCKIAPALLAGNTVVVKPSPLTPLATLRMVALLAAELPPGVLNAVSGGPGVGPALVNHPSVALISFTGSVAVGRSVAEAAARRLVPVVLELGGNDPALVLPDADVDRVAPDLFARATTNSGQFCAAIKRIYAPRARYDELVDRLSECARRVRVGDGRDPVTQLGPLTPPDAVSRVETLIAEASAEGATVAGRSDVPDGPGFFCPATIVRDLAPGARLEREEQFAPVVPVMAYDDPADAVRAANATEYGLGASVWGDPEHAEILAAGIDAGTVWINTHGDLRHDVPFGGRKSSGMGVEYGLWGLLEHTRIGITHRYRRSSVS